MGKILDFFVPRDKTFLKMLDDAGENSMRGIDVFSEFISEYKKLSAKQKKEYLEKIEDIEHRGDKITHVINERLNQTFVTPIDKEDINHLTGLIDDVIDLIYSTTKQIVLYDLKNIEKHIIDITKIIKSGMKEILILISDLKQIRFSKETSINIHQLENEGDEIYQSAMVELYSKKIDPTEMIKLKDIYYNLELVTDKMEDISVVIQGIVIKHG